MKINGGESFYHISHTVKHGRQLSFSFLGLSFSQLRSLLAGIFGVGIGVAGLIMARGGGTLGRYHSLPWTSKAKDSSNRPCFVAGLQNLGNNCFLNVILQALSSCCCFYPFLQNIIEADDSVVEGSAENLPLAVALVALSKELSILRDERIVLSPRRVMLAMERYVTSFNLTRQQDAAEAFIHLLSSLQEEILDCYIPHYGSLADTSSLPVGRISNPGEGGNELERWQRHLLGPFDGTLGSILTCKSCLFQLSVDFEFFNCLPLSPELDGSASIMDKCTLEDCLKQFTAVEHIENYHCSRCWHVAATKFLSLKVEENEEKIKKLRECINHDTCDCKKLYLPEGLPWSVDFSCAFKQLSIGRCPKILCMHLQRASMNQLGEIIKLQGHISFPIVLDIFPFTAAALGMGVDILEKDTQMKAKQQQSLVPHQNCFRMQTMPFVYGLLGKHISFVESVGPSIYRSSGDNFIQTCNGDGYDSNACLENKTQVQAGIGSKDSMHPQHDDKSYMYRLVSVVEHYGKAGSGHYAVYRSAKAKSDAGDSEGKFKIADVHWFYVSDNQVMSVSEEAVLAAEASLLFYERIEVSR
ncbi:ubiquitin carboxyl-terminal hydrolase 27 isoform X2 [Magnolia sinica]|uniref:ubiquitin carboxyl-terminal hydrolase 27 isoform X2 n=1 Tax=Magnolia sinica TaxID=86752 RepID=UPI0026581BCB|nr:ubiquitin carboxyl-terminal hydrolase 27 isoform X2 [Magnolia sinica]